MTDTLIDRRDLAFQLYEVMDTESLIQRGIARVISGRTSIIVAHRLNTIRVVDRILVLHQGRLVEAGTHGELVAQDGYYTRLYELQYREQEPAGGGRAAGRHSEPGPAPGG